MSSGPPPANPNQQNPGPASNGGELSAVIGELKQLVDLQKSSIGLQQASYKLLVSNQQSGSYAPSQQSTDDRGFPIRNRGIEGLLRRSALGLDTTKRSAKAVASSIGKATAFATEPIRKSKAFQWAGHEAGVIGGKIGRQLKKLPGAQTVAKYAKRGAGAVGTAGRAVGDLAMGFIKARDAVEEWTEASLKSAKQLSAMSGAMAGVMAEKMVYDLKRDQLKGQQTAGTTRGLVQAENERKKSEDRIDVVWTNIKNKGLEWGNILVSKIINPFAAAVEKANRLLGLDKLGSDGDPNAYGLGSMEKQIMDWNNAIDKRGQNLMDIARQAGSTGLRPQGQMPPGPMGGRP